jgi:hypothetical protein
VNRLRVKQVMVAATTVLAAAGATGAGAGAATPTCSGSLGVEVHGQHIVGDYVTGVGHDTLPWPPAGGLVGEATAGSGAAIRGGPGPGFHFPNNVAPGASFCTDSDSPGAHF